MSFATIRAAARAYAKVDSNVVGQGTGGDEAKAVLNAGRTYSVDRPRRLTAAITSTGTWEYALATMDSGWTGDHQVVRVCEDGGLEAKSELDSNDWETYQHADETWYLRFLAGAPSSGKVIWVEYSAPHSFAEDPDADTITTDHPNDADAVAHLAASYILLMAASKYAEQFDSTVSADAVARPNVSGAYMARAKAEREEYDKHMSKKPRANSARVDWDSSMTGGSDRIFRRRSWF